MTIRKLFASLGALALAVTAVTALPGVATAASSATDAKIEFVLTNAGSGAQGAWQVGDVAKYKTILTASSTAINRLQFDKTGATNIDNVSAIEGCRATLAAGASTTCDKDSLLAKHTLKAEDISDGKLIYSPYATMLVCEKTAVNDSNACAATSSVRAPFDTSKQDNANKIYPVELIQVNQPPAGRSAFRPGETVQFKLKVTNGYIAARSFETTNTNLKILKTLKNSTTSACRWGTVNAKTSATCMDNEATFSYTVTDKDVAQGATTISAWADVQIEKPQYDTNAIISTVRASKDISVEPVPTAPEPVGAKIVSPSTSENSDLKVVIRTDSQPASGDRWQAGETVKFKFDVTNKTKAAKAVEIISTNLFGADGCKWSNMASNKPQTCWANSNEITYTITDDDVKAGVFVPWATFAIHNTNKYDSPITSTLTTEDAPATSSNLVSTITVSNTKPGGARFTIGDRINFKITLVNKSGKDRSFDSAATNLSGAESCKWAKVTHNAAALECSAAYHVVTKEDIDRGFFTPSLVWKMYSGTGRPSNPAPVDQPATLGVPVAVEAPALEVSSFAISQNSKKAPYTAGDEITFDVTVHNPRGQEVDVSANSAGTNVVFSDEKCLGTYSAQQSKTCTARYTVTKEDLTYGFKTFTVAFDAAKNGTKIGTAQGEVYGHPTHGSFDKTSKFSTKDADPTAAPAAKSDLTVLAKANSSANQRIPAITTAANGDILASYDYRPKNQIIGAANGRNGGDSPNENWIMQRRSTDNGKTWGEPTVISMGKNGSYGYSDPSYVVDYETGKIFNFHVYSQKSGVVDNRPGYKYVDGKIDETNDHTMNLGMAVSSDNGYSWTERIVTDQALRDKAQSMKLLSCFATSGAGIQKLQDPHKGRLIQQIACVKDKDGNGISNIGADDVVAFSMYSDDHGETWKTGAAAPLTATDGSALKYDENKVVELGNGDLMMNSRHNSGTKDRLVAISNDGGETWKDAHIDKTLVDAVNNAHIIRAFPNAKANTLRSKVLLFSNTANTNARTNGTVRISYDNGQTWAASKVFNTGGTGYTVMTRQNDGSIGLLLEPDGNGWMGISYINFNLQWIDADLDSELKAKTGIEDKTGTDGNAISAIPVADMFERNDPALADTITVEGIPAGLSYNADTGSIEGTPSAGITQKTTYRVTVKLTEAEDGTGYPREATATFDLVLEPKLPVVDPTEPTDPSEPSEPTEPSEPADPSEPTDPTEPSEDIDPDTDAPGDQPDTPKSRADKLDTDKPSTASSGGQIAKTGSASGLLAAAAVLLLGLGALLLARRHA